MSAAERCYRVALRAFPKQYREERGDEVIATILEGGDGWRPRLREFFGLLWAGVAQRSLSAGGSKTAGSVRAGIRLGAYFLFWLEANGATASLVHFHGNHGRHGLVLSVGAVVIGVSVLLALSRGWWAAPITLVFAWELGSAVFLDAPSHWFWHSRTGSVAYWAVVFLPALLCLLARPHKQEPRDLRSPLWAIAAPALGALMGWQWSALYTNPLVGLVFVALLVGWLVLGWRDLRLSIALSTVAVYFGANLLVIGGTEGNRVGTFVVIELICLLIAVVTIAIGLAGRRIRA
jgi:hypothetical protein